MSNTVQSHDFHKVPLLLSKFLPQIAPEAVLARAQKFKTNVCMGLAPRPLYSYIPCPLLSIPGSAPASHADTPLEIKTKASL